MPEYAINSQFDITPPAIIPPSGENIFTTLLGGTHFETPFQPFQANPFRNVFESRNPKEKTKGTVSEERVHVYVEKL